MEKLSEFIPIIIIALAFLYSTYKKEAVKKKDDPGKTMLPKGLYREEKESSDSSSVPADRKQNRGASKPGGSQPVFSTFGGSEEKGKQAVSSRIGSDTTPPPVQDDFYDFQNMEPEDWRKAVLFSEILQRKEY